MATGSKVSLGVCIMAVSGLVMTAMLVAGKAVKELQYPYWSLMTGSNALMVVGFALFVCLKGGPLPERAQLKWVLLRALCSMGTFVTGIAAVQAGSTPGDVAALTSINIVGAAVLGHWLLSERLTCAKAGATVLSVLGAVLVARPPFLFARSAAGFSWLGCLLALASGFARAGMYICSRKCAEVSVALVSMVVGLTSLPCFVALALLLDEAPGAALQTRPWECLGLVAAAVVLSILAIGTGIAGAMMCPAAVSATVYTASSMLAGYLAQTLLFGQAPGTVTLCGASAMLLAVLVLTASRVARPAAAPEPQPGEDSDVASETESIASFAAAEFAVVSPHSESVRLRKPKAPDARVVADVVGAAAAA